MTGDRPRLSREPVDIGVLTVISPEFTAARDALGALERVPRERPGDPIYYLGAVYSELCGRDCTVVLTAIDTAGNSDAAAVTAQLIERYHPRVMLLMGIAAGIRDKVRIGEVLFVERVVAYEKAALVAGQDGSRRVQNAPDIPLVRKGLRQDVFHYTPSPERLAKLFARISGRFPTPPAGREEEWLTHVASSITCRKQVTIASGEKLLRDPSVLEGLRHDLHRKVEAGDMEAAGFATACENADTPWLVIRGISDFGDTLKDDAFHELASRSAAAVMADFIAHGLDLGADDASGPRERGAHRLLEAIDDLIPLPEETSHFQRPRGLEVSLGSLELSGTGGLTPADPRQACDALEKLEAWAADPGAPPFFALLGEYGIGKTTTLKQLCRELRAKRRSRPELPFPIYVDLRDYVGATRDGVPTIEQLLASVIQRRWRPPDGTLEARDVLALVRDEGALILFDGLDEKIAHLERPDSVAFIRALWDILPGAAWEAAPASPGRRRGKLLISCRSHYFREAFDQRVLLADESREGRAGDGFSALDLLPFTAEQIQGYLASLLGGPERGTAALDVITSIHDLRGLAERPFLLSLIGGNLGQLEALRARGEEVNTARLYELFTRSWFIRDVARHQLGVDHKRRLMEDLAAALWRDGSKQWDVERLEAWLDDYLAASPALIGAYAKKDRAVLKEDLRTATFILRPATEEKHFRFAHTSLQEYFLAACLKRALLDDKAEQWDLPRVSRETLDFLGQMLAFESRSSAALRAMERILGGQSLKAALLAFEYWLLALEREYPAPAPTRVRLTGANLEEWHIRGRGPTEPLNLNGAELSHVRLSRARLEHVELADSDLTAIQARQALFLNVSALRARAQGADFRGLRWREGSLEGAQLQGARLEGCQWLQVALTEVALPAGWERHAWAGRELALEVGTPVLTTLTGHFLSVNACAWSPDGQRLVSGSDDHSLKVWDAESGECLLTLTGHTGQVSACAWSPDGQRLVSGATDERLKVWGAHSGQHLLTLGGYPYDDGHSHHVNACAWSPDGQRLVSGSDDHSLKVWDAGRGACLSNLHGHSEPVNACAWSPDGQRLVSGSSDQSVKVWDARSGACLLTLTGHSAPVNACAWSPDGRQLVSGSDDKSLRVWDAERGECLRILTGHTGAVEACAWNPDGKLLVSGAKDRSLKVWDVRSGRCLRTLKGSSGHVKSCVWSPDGLRLVSVAVGNASLRVWDAESGACLLTLAGYFATVTGCAWSPDGKWVASSSSDHRVRVWDAESGACLLTLPGQSNGRSSVCAWSPDGKRLASGSDDHSLRIWDARSGACLLTLPRHFKSVTACAWSPDGKRLVSGAGSDPLIKVWDMESGACLLSLPGHSQGVNACAWSPDGRRLVSASYDGTLRVWDAESGACLRILTEHSVYVNACAWSPDGKRVVSASADKSLKVWDVESGECLRTIEHHVQVNACAWSPDGKRLVSGAWHEKLQVWDAEEAGGRPLLNLTGHSISVNACAWSPDGQRLVSGGADNSMKVWDSTSGQCLWSGYVLPEGQTVSLDGDRKRVLHASDEAWRWIGWRWTEPDTGRLRILPIEAFDPLDA